MCISELDTRYVTKIVNDVLETDTIFIYIYISIDLSCAKPHLPNEELSKKGYFLKMSKQVFFYLTIQSLYTNVLTL